MSALSIAGVGTSLRVQWRTGWKVVLAWVLGLTAVVLLTTTSITGLYDTPDKLRSYAETTAGPGMRVLNGAVAGTDTLGGVLVNELGFVVAFAALAVVACAFAHAMPCCQVRFDSGRGPSSRPPRPAARGTRLVRAELCGS